MIISEVVVAILLAVQFNAHSGEAISQPIGVAVIVFICLFVAGWVLHWLARHKQSQAAFCRRPHSIGRSTAHSERPTLPPPDTGCL